MTEEVLRFSLTFNWPRLTWLRGLPSGSRSGEKIMEELLSLLEGGKKVSFTSWLNTSFPSSSDFPSGSLFSSTTVFSEGTDFCCASLHLDCNSKTLTNLERGEITELPYYWN